MRAHTPQMTETEESDSGMANEARVDSAMAAAQDAKKSSLLGLSNEQLAERNEKKKLINVLLPLSVAVALAANYFTNGAFVDTLSEAKLPGAGPPGLEAARELRAKSEAKSKAAYSKFATTGEVPDTFK
jgi:hypothetical protein